MTTCTQAIKLWESKNEMAADEAEEVRLYCQIPPITRLDNSLNTLRNCEHLSLSTNAIDRMIALSGMRRLRILSMGRNGLKRIEKLEDVAETLEELWLSYNQISSLDGLSSLQNLTTLYLSNNNIRNWSELDKIGGRPGEAVILPNLRDVLFLGNPIYDGLTPEQARIEVLRHLPQVSKIDGDMVKPAERERAMNFTEDDV